METDALIDVIRRAPVFAALRERPLDRRDLQETLDVSRPTVHRLTRALDERGLIERVEGEFALTALGETVAASVESFEREVTAASRVAPVLSAVRDETPPFDATAFADATVTSAEPGNPYRPVNRFMTLVTETETLRGLDPATINPLHLDDIHERIVEGMQTEAVFPAAVVSGLFESAPDRMATAFESGNLSLRTHDSLPFGLTLCDERVGVGVYDDETGLLRTYVDTDAPAAYEWAEAVYDGYHAAATPLAEHDALADLPSAAVSDRDD